MSQLNDTIKMQCLYNYVIVDDNLNVHKTIKNILASCEWLVCVHAFTCLSDAVCFMQSAQIDFIFLDLELPDMDGLEIFNLLNNVPCIILISAYIDQFYKGICSNIHKGIVACVEKPINPTELINLMTSLRENL